MPEPISGGGALLKLGASVVELAVKEGWFEKLVNALKTRHRILILGSTGVGKTNLLDSLRTALPQAIDSMNRTEFVERQKLKLGDMPFEFVDTPGQIEHVSRRREAIRQAMQSPIAGIINVVSFGYHEHKTGEAAAFDALGNVSQDYLQIHRALEIEQVDEWASLLGDQRTAGWLITVITKADLWWDKAATATAHYRTGEYRDALAPASDLKPVTLDYCSLFQKFYGRGLLSGRVDDGDRTRMRSSLLSAILAGVAESDQRK